MNAEQMTAIEEAAERCGRPEVRVSRKCPACLQRAAHRGNYLGVSHQLYCMRCGEVWTGRILNKEQR